MRKLSGGWRIKSFARAARFRSAKNAAVTKNFCVAGSLKFKCRRFYRALQAKSFYPPAVGELPHTPRPLDIIQGKEKFYGKYH